MDLEEQFEGSHGLEMARLLDIKDILHKVVSFIINGGKI